MTPDLPLVTGADLVDTPAAWPVTERSLVGAGAVFDLMRDRVIDPTGASLRREWIRHPGAVGIIALDRADRLVLVRQYRHPAGYRLVEPPAGLLDVDGEESLPAAQRELAEEVGLQAADWRVLVDQFTSPGASQESIRIFLARGLSPAPRPDGFVADGEEAQMDVILAPLADVVDAILAGRLQNPVLIAGALAAWTVRTRGGEDTLRPADAPWSARRERVAFLGRRIGAADRG